MTLDQYFAATGQTQKQLARAAGLSDASISRIRAGGQNIRLDIARRIIAASGGKVTIEGLLAPRVAS